MPTKEDVGEQMSRRRGPSKTTRCRKCPATIPVDSRYCPECGSAQKADTVPIILVVLLICSSALLMSSTYITNKQADNAVASTSPTFAASKPAITPNPPPPANAAEAAYTAAKRFVQEQFPNARKISGLNESPVGKNGSIYQVTVFVDSVEGGSIVRNVVQVKLEMVGGDWKLRDITQ